MSPEVSDRISAVASTRLDLQESITIQVGTNFAWMLKNEIDAQLYSVINALSLGRGIPIKLLIPQNQIHEKTDSKRNQK